MRLNFAEMLYEWRHLWRFSPLWERALCAVVVVLSSLRMVAYVPQSLAAGNVVGGFLSPTFWGVWVAPTFIFLLWFGTVDRSPMELTRRSASSQSRVNNAWLWCAAALVSCYYSAFYAVLCRAMSKGALPSANGFWPLWLFVQTLLALVVLGSVMHLMIAFGVAWGRVMPVMLAAVVLLPWALTGLPDIWLELAFFFSYPMPGDIRMAIGVKCLVFIVVYPVLSISNRAVCGRKDHMKGGSL
ncbi:hypothetical protein KIH75_05500 [Bifidobacterium sp. 64T4]|uniref:hypothetical protein n=1 Tax=Bifidobacterium pongonis TaxID=2834432 RepID=UPI001C569B20|nr:hypothetical protein [Bifidobacterium pongonis]MBW3094800.1 hypothetical protein [Bifidobacterium pongonis]